jgi:CHAD domain-containing protein
MAAHFPGDLSQMTSKHNKLTVGDLRREIVRRLDRAMADVSRTASPEDKSIHAVRRACKRIRAHLDLFSRFDQANSRRCSRLVRDAARQLSPYRDSQIIPVAIGHVVSSVHPPADVSNLLVAMNVVKTLDDVSAGDCQQTADPLAKILFKVRNKLKKARRIIKSVDSFDKTRLAATALHESYAAGRKFVAINRQTRSAAAFHELRKAVKKHLYQCQFMAPLNKRQLKRRIKSLRELGEQLGSAQDIAVLDQAVANSDTLESDARTICRKACQKAAANLQSASISLACELYFESASEFIRGLDR